MKSILLPSTVSPLLSTYRIIPDSAIGRNRLPLFLPSSFGPLSVILAVGVRISRLGKEIEPRFARRYFDAINIMAVTIPDNPDVMPPALWFIKDWASVSGKWIEVDTITDGIDTLDIAAAYRHPNSNIETSGCKLDNFTKTVDDAIALVSQGTTLKTGDLILAPLHLSFRPEDNAFLNSSINGICSLDFHFKI